MKDRFVYSLRIGICPDFYETEKFHELLEFCKRTGIDDVQFFLNQEEVNLGHPTEEEVCRGLEMIGAFKPLFEAEGIHVSLNPWTTTLHADRGRTLREDQDFLCMVDLNGKQAKAQACPKDEKFQNYMKKIYGMYAELQFEEIWIEDDFRLHNHAPLEWGGCFCERHMEEFSKRIGKKVTIEEMVDGILKSGAPHPYRKVWLDTARDTMIDFAELLGNCIHEKSPNTRVGLMSSAPEVHCIEGRDWEKVLGNLSGDTKWLNRPHLPAYSENTGRRYALEFQRYSRLTAAVLKGKAEIWPELDNLPHTTFSKSHKFAQLEMESALALCAEGITINIFDMTGNGIVAEEKNDKMLLEVRPYLDGVRNLNLKFHQEQGVTVLYSPKSSYTIHTSGKREMPEIQPNETFWAEYLSAYGIANKYSDDPKVKGQIVAVAGQYFRNLSPEEIRDLFRDNAVILEGEAAETLLDMGLGDLIGAVSAKWYALNGGFQSYEQVADGKIYHGLPKARITAQALGNQESGDYLKIEYTDSDRDTFTVLKRANDEYAGDGLTIRNNVVIFPYGRMRNQYNYLLNPVRRDLLQHMITQLDVSEYPAMIKACQYVAVNDYVQDEQRILLLTNYTTDDFENVVVEAGGKESEVFEISRETGEVIPLKHSWCNGRLTLDTTLRHMQSRCLILR